MFTNSQTAVWDQQIKTIQRQNLTTNSKNKICTDSLTMTGHVLHSQSVIAILQFHLGASLHLWQKNNQERHYCSGTKVLSCSIEPELADLKLPVLFWLSLSHVLSYMYMYIPCHFLIVDLKSLISTALSLLWTTCICSKW